MKKVLTILSLFILAVSLYNSCSRLENADNQADLESGKLKLPERIYFSNNLAPGNPLTKSNSEILQSVDSESLDIENMETKTEAGHTYYQIRIKSSSIEYPTRLEFRSIDRDSVIPEGKSRGYLLVADRSDKDSLEYRVVTMIFNMKYMTPEMVSRTSSFNLNEFTGILSVSDINGNILDSRLYASGYCGDNVCLVEKPYNEVENPDVVLYRPHSSVMTKGDDWEIDLPEILVIDERPDPEDPKEYEDEQGGTDDWWYINYFEGGGFVGGGSSGDSGSNEMDNIRKVTFRIDGFGSISTPFTITIYDNQPVECEAIPLEVAGIRYSEFIGWYLSGNQLITTSPKLNHVFQNVYVGRNPDIDITVKFHNIEPCYDDADGRRDPLMEMRILGTRYGGIAGGRFDGNRGDHKHGGLDLAASVSTPVYSMCDGMVTMVRDVFREGVPFEDYDSSIDKRIRNAGNVVWIKSANANVVYRYLHLSRIFVEEGESVSAGEVIGLVGTTGNANTSGCAGPHLHLETWDSETDTKVNPEKYIFAGFDDTGKNIRNCK